MRKRKQLTLLISLLVLMVVGAISLSACGGGSSSSSSTSEPSGTSEEGATESASDEPSEGSTGEGRTVLKYDFPDIAKAEAEAEKLGEEAAAEAGAGKKLPSNKMIGFVNISKGIEAAEVTVEEAELAASKIGYELVECDGQGEPSKQVACANTLLNQGAAALMTNSVEPSVLASPIRKAESKGVPFIEIDGSVAPGFTAEYTYSDVKLGQELASFAEKELEKAGLEEADTDVQTYAALWGESRTEALQEAAKKNSVLNIVSESSTDPANVVGSSEQATKAAITQYPELKLIWCSYNSAGQAAAQVLASEFPGKTFPERPMLLTFLPAPEQFEAMRAGILDGAANVNAQVSVWIGMDQLLQYFSGGKMSEELAPEYGKVGDLYTYDFVTPENVPPEGEKPAPEVEYGAFFEAKWKKEFGIG
jgi:ABC-type sugar transport system substrate-binding protein